MAKKIKKTDALAIPIDSQAIVVKTREVAALAVPASLNELKRSREIYKAAVGYAKTIKGVRVKLLEAASLQLRTELQIGAILQEMNRGNDVTDTSYEDFLQEQVLTTSQAIRWRDMGYKMAKKLKVNSIIDESLKFSPAFFAKFEEYVTDCSQDPLGDSIPSFNGFVDFLHQTNEAREKARRLAVLTVFCRNLPFADAEILYQKIRVSDHLDVTQADFDTLVWGGVLDRRNLFQGQATIMNVRDKAAKVVPDAI